MSYEIRQRHYPTAAPWVFTGTDYPTLEEAIQAGREAQVKEPTIEFRVKGPEHEEVHYEEAPAAYDDAIWEDDDDDV